MEIKVEKTSHQQVAYLRSLFLQENNFLIRYNACHTRNWADVYFLMCQNQVVGYGAVKGKDRLEDRNAIFEMYVLPPYRKLSNSFLKDLIKVSNVNYIECQSNDLFLTSLLYENTNKHYSDTILFEEDTQTQIELPEVQFKKRKPGEYIRGKKEKTMGAYILVLGEQIIATGGFLLHYNHPFADLYMEVAENYRKKGYGTYILQEIKQECYLSGRVPAARCNASNEASKATLLNAGFKVAGYMLIGEIKSIK